jgi:hypothetical protein
MKTLKYVFFNFISVSILKIFLIFFPQTTVYLDASIFEYFPPNISIALYVFKILILNLII